MTPKYETIESYIRQNPKLTNREIGGAWLTPSDKVAKIRKRLWWEDNHSLTQGKPMTEEAE